MDVTLVSGVPASGGSGTADTDLVINPTFGSAHVNVLPDEYQAAGRILGHYSISGVTSAIAPTAAAPMLSFRWADTSALALIKRVRASIGIVTAVTAQACPDLDMIVARGYTARDATGATAVAFTVASTGKMRVGMGTSLAANIDVASAAGGTTGGTKTLDTSPISLVAAPPNVYTIGGGSALLTLFDCTLAGQHPLVLTTNEGFQVRTPTAIGSGTVKVYVAIDWAEVPAY